MPTKKTVKKSVQKTVGSVIKHAKDSLKLLEGIDMKKIGVASVEDIEKLRLRIERLEGEVAVLKQAASGTSGTIPQG